MRFVSKGPSLQWSQGKRSTCELLADRYRFMIRRLHVDFVIGGAWLIAWPSVAAEADAASESADVVTGLSNTGPGLLIIGLASALLLTLLFRASATHVIRVITERLGHRRIRKILEQRSKDVLDDFILPGAYGGLTRVNHAILTSGGILCIQTKHYNGIVFGAADEPQWTNVDGVHRRKFLNPLIQNEGRTKALQKVVPEVPVANLVVFTGSVQFTTRSASVQ